MLIRKDRQSCLAIYSITGIVPRSVIPYNMAFTHSSRTTSANKRLKCNERLEFLGDAVLSSVVSDYLYRKYNNEREGFLSKSRSNLVCRERLNAIAVKIGLDKFISTDGITSQHNSYLYGNALEALVGAIYVDAGYDACRRFILKRVLTSLQDIEVLLKSDNNYKSRLIEWSQKQKREVVFSLVDEEQRKDGAFFISEVFVDGVSYGIGDGFSKRESQQKAAYEALQQLELI